MRVCVCVVSQVQDTKAELNGLGDGIEQVRSVCRQLHTHLRQMPECTTSPFEGEADALMDRWLDVSTSCLHHFIHLLLLLPVSVVYFILINQKSH